MKKIFVFGLALFMACISFSQENSLTKVPGQTSFYAELGGPGILFSANFDRRFKKTHLGLGGRIGIGFVSVYDDNYDPYTGTYYGGDQVSVLTVPAQINYIFGKNNSPHTFEVGAGLTIVGKKVDLMDFYDTRRSGVFGTFAFMYRRQPKDGGFTWRIGFTPLVANGYIQPFGAAGVGYNF